MSAELGGVPEPVGWLGHRNIIVPPDIIPTRRVSPIPKKKRTPCHPRPEGAVVCRAGNREWFSDHLFVDAQAPDLRNACGTSFTAHASCLIGFLVLLAGPDVTAPVRVSSPLRMPAFIASISGGAGSLPQLALKTPEEPALPRKAAVVKTSNAHAFVPAAEPPVALTPAFEETSTPADATTESPNMTDNAASESGEGGEGSNAGSPGAGRGTGRGAGEGSGIGISPGPYRLGHGIESPRKIKDVAPVYPADALTLRALGTVIIEATVGVDGKVHETKIVHSIPALDQAALDAVRQWEFSPARLNGAAVAVIITVLVQFSIH